MTKDEIIEMAKQCELVVGNAEHGIYLMALQRFAALVAEKEREACANVCDRVVDGKDPDDIHSDGQWAALTLAAEIRARKP